MIQFLLFAQCLRWVKFTFIEFNLNRMSRCDADTRNCYLFCWFSEPNCDLIFVTYYVSLLNVEVIAASWQFRLFCWRKEKTRCERDNHMQNIWQNWPSIHGYNTSCFGWIQFRMWNEVIFKHYFNWMSTLTLSRQKEIWFLNANILFFNDFQLKYHEISKNGQKRTSTQIKSVLLS